MHKYPYLFSWDDFVPDPNENIDSCILHSINHEDTEILGYFCDKTGLHGNDLKKILTIGFYDYQKR